MATVVRFAPRDETERADPSEVDVATIVFLAAGRLRVVDGSFNGTRARARLDHWNFVLRLSRHSC
jgi:hypothetical protein